MKRIIAFLIILTLCAMNMIVVVAEVVAPVETLDGDNITITGKLPVARVKNVTLQVLNPGRNVSEFETQNPPAFKEVIAYHGQVESKSDGSFEFKFVIKNDTPTQYPYFITATGYEVSDTLDYYGSKYNEYIIKQINDNRSNETMVQGLVTDNYSKLNVQAAVYQKLLSELPGKIGEVYACFKNFERAADVSDLSMQLNQASALVFINQASSVELMKTDIGLYVSTLGTDKLSAYKVYDEILDTNTTIRDKVLQNIIGGRNYTDVKSFNDKFRDETIITTFNDIPTWSEMQELLKKTQDVTLINFSECDALTYPENVYRALLSETVTAVDQIDDKFYAAVTSVKTGEGGNNGSFGGNGGNGGGGFGGGAGAGYTPENISSPYVPNSGKFLDLNGFEWAEADIYFLKEKGIVNGKTETAYEPAAAITREEFVKLLVLTAGIGDEETTTEFSDVIAGSWYESYVKRAVAAGVIQGMGNGSFGIGSNIKREDMAVMIHRIVYGELKSGNPIDFADEGDISDYAHSAVKDLAQSGMLLGTDGNRFEPKAEVTRAQAAVVLRRVYNLLGKEASV